MSKRRPNPDRLAEVRAIVNVRSVKEHDVRKAPTKLRLARGKAAKKGRRK